MSDKEPLWIVWQFGDDIGTVGGWTKKEAIENAEKFFGKNNCLSVTLGCGVPKDND
jgi:hypothetical protein